MKKNALLALLSLFTVTFGWPEEVVSPAPATTVPDAAARASRPPANTHGVAMRTQALCDDSSIKAFGGKVSRA